MLIFGSLLIIVSVVAAFAIGFSINRWNNLVSYIGYIAVIFSTASGIMLFYFGVEKDTLIKYDNEEVSYKVTNVDVEHNKTTDIRVIYEE